MDRERKGVDIAFEKALLGWLVENSAGWQRQRQTEVF